MPGSVLGRPLSGSNVFAGGAVIRGRLLALSLASELPRHFTLLVRACGGGGGSGNDGSGRSGAVTGGCWSGRWPCV